MTLEEQMESDTEKHDLTYEVEKWKGRIFGMANIIANTLTDDELVTLIEALKDESVKEKITNEQSL